MPIKRAKKIATARKQLEAALLLYKEADSAEQRSIFFLTVVKAFEILVQYAWKHLKQKVEDEGLEAPSPKEAIRQAASANLIDNPEAWLSFITARNLSVHDYFGIPEQDYLNLAKQLLASAQKL